MKAVRYYETGSPEVLKLEDVPKPEPGPDDVLVKVAAAGVNFAEVGRRSGHFPLPPGQSLPQVPGYECAGEVEWAGANVSGFKPGDRVLGRAAFGTYQDYTILSPEAMYIVPPSLSLVEAATVNTTFTAAWAIVDIQGEIKAGETVLVQAAASGVAIAAVQLAKHVGATVIGTASTDEKLEWAKGYGLDHGINYAKDDFVEKVKELTGGKGVDVVIDGVGGDVFLKGLKALRLGGRMLVYGVAGGVRTAEVTLPELWFQVLTIKGAGHGTNREQTDHLLALLDDGTLKATVDKTWPLEQAAEAHRYLEERRVRGKVALTTG